MTAAGKRLWPNEPRMTPYYLRHAFASDLKRGRHIAQDDISAAMGHCVNKTTAITANIRSESQAELA
jgi:integrase